MSLLLAVQLDLRDLSVGNTTRSTLIKGGQLTLVMLNYKTFVVTAFQ